MTLHSLLTDLVRAVRFQHTVAVTRLRAELSLVSATDLATYRANLRRL